MTPEELLPAWVTWAPWLWAPFFGVAGYACVAVLLRNPKLPAEPWTERAREVYRLRMLVALVRLTMLAGGTAVGVLISTDHAGRMLGIALAGFAGGLLPALRFEDQLAGRTTRG